jgi:hypothetical protein
MKFSRLNAERINRNLWKIGKNYYRLFAAGITPNGCWLLIPTFRHLSDIECSTGQDVYGTKKELAPGTGSIQASGLEFLPL